IDEAGQRALPGNLRLMAWPTWNEVAGHVTTAARRTVSDWASYSTEDANDTYDGGSADSNGNITPWHPFRQEVMAFNVLTGEARRLAHHRSRSISDNYYNTPRLSTSWGAKWVGWASNYNQPTCPGCS